MRGLLDGEEKIAKENKNFITHLRKVHKNHGIGEIRKGQ